MDQREMLSRVDAAEEESRELLVALGKVEAERDRARKQVLEEVRERLEELDRYVVGAGSSGGHYEEHTVGQMYLMNNENARGERGQWIQRAEAIAALDVLEAQDAKS